MITDNSDQRETDAAGLDPLDAVATLFDLETIRISPCAHLSVAVPGAALRRNVPSYPLAACPQAGRVGMGCDPDPGRSSRSAIGEAVELASVCAWGDEGLVRARPADLGPSAVDTAAVVGLSARQFQEREIWNRRYGGYDWRPPPAGGGPIDWIAAEAAGSGETRYIAADAVLIGRRQKGDEAAVAIADSNGCAAGATLKAARTAALLELIERDAVGRWWYGRRRRPILPLPILASWPGLVSWLDKRDRRTCLLDITTDLGIPVVAAVSCGAGGMVPAFGFAARPGLAEAARAAVMEMQGVETSLPPWRDVSDDPLMLEWLDRGPAAIPPSAPGKRPIEPPELGDPLESCLCALERLGHHAYFVDLTRAVFDVPVSRAIVPGLCHYKPRFGNRRLLAPDPRDIPPTPVNAELPNPVSLLI